MPVLPQGLFSKMYKVDQLLKPLTGIVFQSECSRRGHGLVSEKHRRSDPHDRANVPFLRHARFRAGLTGVRPFFVPDPIHLTQRSPLTAPADFARGTPGFCLSVGPRFRVARRRAATKVLAIQSWHLDTGHTSTPCLHVYWRNDPFCTASRKELRQPICCGPAKERESRRDNHEIYHRQTGPLPMSFQQTVSSRVAMADGWRLLHVRALAILVILLICGAASFAYSVLTHEEETYGKYRVDRERPDGSLETVPVGCKALLRDGPQRPRGDRESAICQGMGRWRSDGSAPGPVGSADEIGIPVAAGANIGILSADRKPVTGPGRLKSCFPVRIAAIPFFLSSVASAISAPRPASATAFMIAFAFLGVDRLLKECCRTSGS